MLIEDADIHTLLVFTAVTRTNIPEDLGCAAQMISEMFVRNRRR